MATTYNVLGKYLGEGYDTNDLIPIGTSYGNRKIRESLKELGDVFAFVEDSLIIRERISAGSVDKRVNDIIEDATYLSELAIKKLIGKKLPEDPELLRIHAESVLDEDIKNVVGATVWTYLQSTAKKYDLKKVRDIIKYIKELASTDKAFYSKWSEETPIEFFDHSTRFSYAPVSDFEYQDETPEDNILDFSNADAHFDYWNGILEDDTPIIANDAVIKTWSDLKKALRGEKIIMDESEFSQGTFSTPLRKTIRLVPPAE